MSTEPTADNREYYAVHLPAKNWTVLLRARDERQAEWIVLNELDLHGKRNPPETHCHLLGMAVSEGANNPAMAILRQVFREEYDEERAADERWAAMRHGNDSEES